MRGARVRSHRSWRASEHGRSGPSIVSSARTRSRRMRPVEFAAELVILLIEGQQNKKKAVDLSLPVNTRANFRDRGSGSHAFARTSTGSLLPCLASGEAASEDPSTCTRSSERSRVLLPRSRNCAPPRSGSWHTAQALRGEARKADPPQSAATLPQQPRAARPTTFNRVSLASGSSQSCFRAFSVSSMNNAARRFYAEYGETYEEWRRAAAAAERVVRSYSGRDNFDIHLISRLREEPRSRCFTEAPRARRTADLTLSSRIVLAFV